MSLENSHCTYYHELDFSQKESGFVNVTLKFGLPLLWRAEIFAKIKEFCWCNLKIRTPLLSRTETLAKLKRFCWSDLKIWTAPIIMNWNFGKNKAASLVWLANLSYPYYHELKCSPRKDSFNNITWKFELPLLSRVRGNIPDLMKLLEYLNSLYYHEGKLFANVRQFCWCDLKIWTALIFTSWIFLKNMADFMKSLESLNSSYYHELKSLQK